MKRTFYANTHQIGIFTGYKKFSTMKERDNFVTETQKKLEELAYKAQEKDYYQEDSSAEWKAYYESPNAGIATAKEAKKFNRHYGL